MKKYIGVDVGGTTTKFGIFSEGGLLIEKREIPTDKRNAGIHILKNAADTISERWIKGTPLQSEIYGIGIGVPGPVQRNGYVEACVNLGVQDINPQKFFSARFPGIQITAANDANAAALGEMWKGAGKGYSSLVLVTIGTGVGSGVVLDERILYGAKGLSGEIGHIMINPCETEICNCGGRGCLDQVASATGIVRNAVRMLSNSLEESLLGNVKDMTAKDVLDAAKHGDRAALGIVDYCMSFMGKCLAEVSYIIDPEIFLIGGGVSAAGAFLIEIIQKYYNQYAILKKDKAKICLAELENDAGIYGAARMVMSGEHKEI